MLLFIIIFLKYLFSSLEIFKSFFFIYFFLWGFLSSRFSVQLSQNKTLDLTSQGVLSQFSVMLWALMEGGGSGECTWLLASLWAGPHLFPWVFSLKTALVILIFNVKLCEMLTKQYVILHVSKRMLSRMNWILNSCASADKELEKDHSSLCNTIVGSQAYKLLNKCI